MLELRPTCEHCNTALPPSATDARIRTFACTSCATTHAALRARLQAIAPEER